MFRQTRNYRQSAAEEFEKCYRHTFSVKGISDDVWVMRRSQAHWQLRTAERRSFRVSALLSDSTGCCGCCCWLVTIWWTVLLVSCYESWRLLDWRVLRSLAEPLLPTYNSTTHSSRTIIYLSGEKNKVNRQCGWCLRNLPKKIVFIVFVSGRLQSNYTIPPRT